MDNLINEKNGTVNKQFANLSFGIVFQLLLSSIENSETFEKPKVGDWCIETSMIYGRTLNLLGIVREITNNGYITQTVFGQTVTWTNCNMVRIPDTLLQHNLYEELLKYLKDNEVEICYV